MTRKPETSTGDADPESFFADFVMPSVEVFLANSLDLRQGVLSAFMVSHQVDNILHGPRIFHPNTDILEDFRFELEGQCTALRHAREISERTRHENVSKVVRLGSSIYHLAKEHGGRVLVEDRQGFFVAKDPKPLFRCRDGCDYDLKEIIGQALNFLAAYLSRHSISPRESTLFRIYSRYPRIT